MSWLKLRNASRLRAAFFVPRIGRAFAAVRSIALAVGILAVPLAGAQAQFVEQQMWAGTAGGTANAITLTVPNMDAPYPGGVIVRFAPSLNNTGPTTVSINGQTPQTLYRPSSIGSVVMSGGELRFAMVTTIINDGNAWILLSPIDMRPIGDTIQFRGTTTPPGYLLEDGSCVSRVTFAPLFSVIGTSYSPCDGSTTFGVPDSRGTTFTALDNQGVNGAAGRVTSAGSGCPGTSVMLCGSQSATLTALQLPVITPTFTGTTHDWQISVDSLPAIPTLLLNSGAPAGAGAAANPLGVNGTNPFVRVTPAGTISSFGGGQSHPVLNPTLLGRRAIKY